MNAAQARRDLTVGKRVAWARKRTGLSQMDFAHRAGVSWRNLIRVENDQVKPRPETIARIAEASGQAIELFAGDDDDEEDGPMRRRSLSADLRRLAAAAALLERDPSAFDELMEQT